MKVLVTGGAGFIGSNVADGLIEEGYDVIIVDDLSNGREENLPEKAWFYKTDVRSKELEDVFKREKPDIVIHNAAQLSVRVSVEEPLRDADINIVGGLNLIDICKRYGVKKVIFASSGGTVYGEQKVFPADESHPLGPISPYGVAKLTTEHYLYYYYKIYGLEYIALRYANIYGPRQDPHGEAGVVAIFSNKILADEAPLINGDGLQTRDYTYVGDVVKVNLAAVRSDFIGPVNIGTGIETDVVKLFNVLKNASGKDIAAKHGPAKTGEQRRSVLDNSLAKKALGWEPEISIEDGLRLTFKWFEEKGDENNMNEIVFTAHAKAQIKLRDISEKIVKETLRKPLSVEDPDSDRKVAQKLYNIKGKKNMIRVVYMVTGDSIKVITAYRTTKILKYIKGS